MRIRWDEAKRQKILGERNVDFGDLDDLLSQPMSRIGDGVLLISIALSASPVGD